MENVMTYDTIAAAVGISARAVRMRSDKEGWVVIRQRVRGGYKHLFPIATLPDDIRAAVIDCPSAGESCGFMRGLSVNGERLDAETARRKAREAGLAVYSALTDEKRAEADARFELLKARDGFLAATRLPKKNGSLLFIKEVKSGTVKLPEDVMAAVPRRRGKIVLSWATLYRWETAYREQGRGGLAGQYVSRQATSVPAHMQAFIQGMIVDHPHCSVSAIRQAMDARFNGQAIPSLSAVRRFVNGWKEHNGSLLLYLKNPDEWKNRYQYAFGDASEQIERLNQLWEFDSTPGDVMLTDGRHTVIGVIDVYSRRGKLLVSPTSKAEAVAALTRRAILDWGVMEKAKTDNGADYVSNHMVRVFSDLEIEQILCPPFTPEAKPHIERFLGTFSHAIVELLPGYIGHSVSDRKAIEARRTFAQRMMQSGSDPVTIHLSSAEFQTICDRWVSAMYHHNVHGSLNGRTPDQVAREWTGPVRRISDERALDVLLCPAPAGGGTRQVKKDGIAIDGAPFFAPELAGHEGETVRVLLDRTDYGTVYVFGLDGAFICRAINPDRTGHDRAEVASRARAVQKQVIQEAAKEARKVAREAKTRFIYEEILQHREAQIANVVEMPKRHEDYTTPALEEASMAAEDARRTVMGPQPIGISEEEERAAGNVIRLAEARQGRRMPASEMEAYEMLMEDMAGGRPVTENDSKWAAEFDEYLVSGKRRGLLAAGYQPFAETVRVIVGQATGGNER